MFIFSLTILGIVTALVYSHKIAHSRVYPVGMVRKMPVPQEAEMDILPYVMPEIVTGILPEDWPGKGISTDLKLSGQTIKYYGGGMPSETSAKYRVISQTGAWKDKTALIYSLRNKYLHEPENLALEKKVVKQEDDLKLHFRLEEMEKRIRQLEIESVKKLQEAAEETPQPPLTVN